MKNISGIEDASPQKHVVIVGGGFAGLHCAWALASADNLRVTLLDRNNYQQLQPLLYQVAMASLAPSRAAFNLRAILMQQGNVDVRMTEVISVDLAARTVTGKDGDTYAGDYLVLAAGAQASFLGVPGAEEYAFPMYSLRDAARLRSRVLEVFEAADGAIDRGQQTVSHLTVIGGGATGVEITGALADICQRAPKKFYKHLRFQDVVVTLVNGKDEVLSGFTEKSKNYARRVLGERGVKLCLNQHVKELTAQDIPLSDGTRMPCSLAIWAGGLKAAALAYSLDLKLGQGGRIDVQPDLTVAGYPSVYALGDFANTGDGKGKMFPQLASVAQQAGRHCAKNILANARRMPTSEFAYTDKGIMAMIGRNAAVAEVGASRHALTGPLAFLTWLGVHAMLLTTLQARIATCLEWIWDSFGGMPVEAILDSPSDSPFAQHTRPIGNVTER